MPHAQTLELLCLRALLCRLLSEGDRLRWLGCKTIVAKIFFCDEPTKKTKSVNEKNIRSGYISTFGTVFCRLFDCSLVHQCWKGTSHSSPEEDEAQRRGLLGVCAGSATGRDLE
eukprot:3545855-Amphidinium_carterae.1